MAKSPFASLLKGLSTDASIASDGVSSAEYSKFIDTGSYSLNAALSGSIFNGMADNKVLTLFGESSVGKSFIILGLLNSWMKENPTGLIVYADTESAITQKMMEERGIDCSRVIKLEPATIEQFRESIVTILNNYSELEKDSRYPMLVVLDSLGNLSSNKEIQDITDHKDTRDMTKSQLLRGTFRVLRLKLAKLCVPMIVANHAYQIITAYVPTKEMSGGGGLKFISDSIVLLTKTKDKDADKNVIGNIITATMIKSRLSKENSKVEFKISYKGGLDRYYGILDMAEASKLVTVSAGKYQFPEGQKPVNAVKIGQDPSTYFTSKFLKELDEKYVIPTFTYGNGLAPEETTEDSE